MNSISKLALGLIGLVFVLVSSSEAMAQSYVGRAPAQSSSSGSASMAKKKKKTMKKKATKKSAKNSKSGKKSGKALGKNSHKKAPKKSAQQSQSSGGALVRSKYMGANRNMASTQQLPPKNKNSNQ